MSRVILNHVTDILPQEVQSALKDLDLSGEYEPRFHQDSLRTLRDELVELTLLKQAFQGYAERTGIPKAEFYKLVTDVLNQAKVIINEPN